VLYNYLSISTFLYTEQILAENCFFSCHILFSISIFRIFFICFHYFLCVTFDFFLSFCGSFTFQELQDREQLAVCSDLQEIRVEWESVDIQEDSVGTLLEGLLSSVETLDILEVPQ